MKLKIKSISDVITNSSTEVFVIKNTKGVRRWIKYLEESQGDGSFIFKHLETEEEVKDFILDVAINGDLWRYEMRYNEGYLTDDKFKELLKEGKNWDDIWEMYRDVYLKDFLDSFITEASNEDVIKWDDDGVDYLILCKIANEHGLRNRLS